MEVIDSIGIDQLEHLRLLSILKIYFNFYNMTLFIIGLVFLVLCLVFIAVPITKTVIYKAVYNATDISDQNQAGIRTYTTLKRNDIGWEFVLVLVFAYMGTMFTCFSISDVREHFVKQYDDHIYEWNQSAYVNDSGEVKVSEERHLKKVKDISDRKTFYLRDSLKVE